MRRVYITVASDKEFSLLLPMLRRTIARVPGLAGESLWVGVGQVVTTVGAFVAVRVLTEQLGADEYGSLALATTVVTLVQQVVFAGTRGSSLRFFAAAIERSEAGIFLHAVWRLLAQRLVLLVGVVALLIGGLVATGNLQWVGFALPAWMYAVLFAVSGVLDGMQNALRQRAVVAWHAALNQWLKIGVILFVFALAAPTAQVTLWCYTLVAALILISQFGFFAVKVRALPMNGLVGPKQLSDEWFQRLATYGWPYATWGLFTWAQISSGRWALAAFATTADVGRYAALYQVGYYPISIVSGLLMTLVAPIIFQRAGDATSAQRVQDARRWNLLLLGLSLILTAMLVLGLVFFHRPLFALVVASDFQAVSSLLPVMALAGGLFASGQVASLLLETAAETKQLIAPKIGTAVIGVLLDIAGAYLFGIRGVAWAEVAFGGLYLAWVIGLAWRYAFDRGAGERPVAPQSARSVRKDAMNRN